MSTYNCHNWFRDDSTGLPTLSRNMKDSRSGRPPGLQRPEFQQSIMRFAALPSDGSLGRWVLALVVWALAVSWAVPAGAQATSSDDMAPPAGLTVTPGNDVGDNTTTMLTAMWTPTKDGQMYQLAWRPIDDSEWVNEVATIDTEFTIDGLKPGSDYLIAVRAASSATSLSWGPWSDLVQASTVLELGAPTGLTVMPGDDQGDTADTMITAMWDVPAGGEPAVYQVAWRPVNDTEWINEPSTIDTEYTIGGLTPGTGYLVAVRASNSYDGTDWGPWSDFAQATTAAGAGFPGLSAPESPTGLTLSTGDDEGDNADTMLTAMWEAPVDIDDGAYEVAWRPVGSSDWVHEASTVETSHTIDGLTPGTGYWVAVRASHSGSGTAWSDWSELVQGTTFAGSPNLPTPDMPTELVLTPGDDKGGNADMMITAMWQPPKDVVGGMYQVAWRPMGSSDWVHEASTMETSYAIGGLTPGTSHLVAVRASHGSDDAVWGPWSELVQGSTASGMPTAPTPGMPVGLSLTPGDDELANADMMITAMWQPPEDVFGGMYQVAWRPMASSDWVHEASTIETSYVIGGLTPGTGYSVAVRASHGGAGAAWGSWSDTVDGRTSAGTGSPGLAMPGSPTGLKLKPGDADGAGMDTMITAMWKAPADIVGGAYEVAWRPVNARAWVHEAATTETSYTIKGLMSGTGYWVAVRASNTGEGTAWGPWSDLVVKSTSSGTTAYDPSAPGMPTDLELTPGDNGTTIDAIWMVPGDSMDSESYDLTYEVAWRPVNRSYWVHEAIISDTVYTIDGLTPGSDYLVAVRASHRGDGTGWGPWSELVRVSTPEGPPISGLPVPGAPTGLDVTPGEDGTTLDMIWVDPADVGGAGSYELAYQVAWRPASVSDWAHEPSTAYPNYSISGLTPNTDYWVAVRAANTGDNTGWGPWSNLVRVRTVVEAVQV